MFIGGHRNKEHGSEAYRRGKSTGEEHRRLHVRGMACRRRRGAQQRSICCSCGPFPFFVPMLLLLCLLSCVPMHLQDPCPCSYVLRRAHEHTPGAERRGKRCTFAETVYTGCHQRCSGRTAVRGLQREDHTERTAVRGLQ